jgi:preprotein translocase subunit YajC
MLYSWLMILAEDAAEKPARAPGWVDFLPFIAIAALFYFLMIAPMKRQEKQRQALVSTLKKNDKIINSGGIIGIVESVKEKENEVVLKGGLRVTKASIVQVVTEETQQKEGKAVSSQ